MHLAFTRPLGHTFSFLKTNPMLRSRPLLRLIALQGKQNHSLCPCNAVANKNALPKTARYFPLVRPSMITPIKTKKRRAVGHLISSDPCETRGTRINRKESVC